MKTRAVTGFFFIAVMLASVLLSERVFVVFFSLLALGSLNEFYGLSAGEGVLVKRIYGFLPAAAICFLLALHLLMAYPFSLLLLCIPLVMLVYIAELYRAKDRPFTNIAYTFLGLIYIVLPYCLFIGMPFLGGSFNYHIPLGFLSLLWANDTGAYLFGVKFGRNPLFERHSPKKTWEGFLGGMLTALLTAFILGRFFTEMLTLHWLVIAVLIVCGGTLGDLCESMLKRHMNVKDSGKLLPGHGGLLDRFDGLLIAAPLVYTYVYLLNVLY